MEPDSKNVFEWSSCDRLARMLSRLVTSQCEMGEATAALRFLLAHKQSTES